LLFSLLLVAACASMPAPDGADATLLIIERGMEMPSSAPEKFYRAVINLSGGAEPIAVTMSGQPMMYSDLAPERYTAELLTRKSINPPGWESKYPVPDRTLDIGKEFEMRAGYITVFPRMLVQYAQSTGSSSYSIGFRMDPANPGAALDRSQRLRPIIPRAHPRGGAARA
jgi:hypothetical protein